MAAITLGGRAILAVETGFMAALATLVADQHETVELGVGHLVVVAGFALGRGLALGQRGLLAIGARYVMALGALDPHVLMLFVREDRRLLGRGRLEGDRLGTIASGHGGAGKGKGHHAGQCSSEKHRFFQHTFLPFADYEITTINPGKGHSTN